MHARTYAYIHTYICAHERQKMGWKEAKVSTRTRMRQDNTNMYAGSHTCVYHTTMFHGWLQRHQRNGDCTFAICVEGGWVRTSFPHPNDGVLTSEIQNFIYTKLSAKLLNSGSFDTLWVDARVDWWVVALVYGRVYVSVWVRLHMPAPRRRKCKRKR